LLSVQPLKVLISSILIFSYSLGFAHNLVSHCQMGHESHESSNHKHEYLHQAEAVSHNHEHISHKDHIDTSWWDFMICLLTDIEHDEANLNFFQTQKSLTVTLISSFDDIDVCEPLGLAEYAIPLDVCEKSFHSIFSQHYESPGVSLLFTRGPPITS
jgi:hypothetical protein